MKNHASMFRITVAIAFLAILLTGTSLAGQIKELKPYQFSSNGPNIMGWHWIRSPGQKATWTFNVPNNISNISPAALCFSTLSTNTFNGGAGHDSTLKIKLNNVTIGNVHLKNDCSCLKNFSSFYSGDSHGIGYHSHGCLYLGPKIIVTKIIRPYFKPTAGQGNHYPPNLTVTAEYYSGHSAVKKDSLKLVIITE